jgi:predicted nucleotidyltransferase
LDRIVHDVVDRAVRLVDPTRVWLFGSHARGDATPTSDVDLAFEAIASNRAAWAAFVLEAEDEVPALVDLDLVDLEMLQDRNLTSHICHSELADRIFAAINTRYAAALTDAVKQVSIALH